MKSLQIKRYDHSCILYKHYLFVLFGKNHEDCIINKVEYIDVRNLDDEFKVIEYKSKDEKVIILKPMIFSN